MSDDQLDGSMVGLLAALPIGIVFVSLLLSVGIWVFVGWCYMRIFAKAGVRNPAVGFIPFYNMMVFLKLGDFNPWLAVWTVGGSLVPIIGWILSPLLGLAMTVVSVIAAYRIGLKLGKEGVWVVLYIFAAYVWLAIMAFDSSRWNKNIYPPTWAANGFIGDRTAWSNVPTQVPDAFMPGAGGYAPPAAGYADPYGAPPTANGYMAPPPAAYSDPNQAPSAAAYTDPFTPPPAPSSADSSAARPEDNQR